MNRKLLTLLLFLLVFGRAFSQSLDVKIQDSQQIEMQMTDSVISESVMILCPNTLPPILNWIYFSNVFDTIGLWDNYPPNWGTFHGKEKVIQMYCMCSAIYKIKLVNQGTYGGSSPYGSYKVFYKESQIPCTNLNYVEPSSYAENWYINDYILPLDSGKMYDIVIDYGYSTFYPPLPGLVDIHFYFSGVTPTFYDIKPDSLSCSWDATIHNVEIKYFPDGGAVNTIYVQNSPYTFTGLLPDTKYNFSFKQACDIYSGSVYSITQKTMPICDSAQIISCDNTFFSRNFPYIPGYSSFSGCTSCPMDQSQKFYQITADTTGTYIFSHSSTTGSSNGKIGAYYKDANLGCNEKNWNFIACGTDKYVWNGSLSLIAGHTYYLCLSSSSCFGQFGFGYSNFRFYCPSPLCSTIPTNLSSNAINNNICIGQPVSLFPNGSMLATSGLYKWYKDSCSGSVISNTKIITVSPLVSTTYFLQIADSCGVLGCDSITIAVNQYPNPVLSLTTDTTICYTDSLLISVNQNSGDTVQWFNNSTPIISASDSSFYIKESGNYFAKIINQFGCQRSSDTISIIVAKPDNHLNISGAISICNGDSLVLTATNVQGNSYQWIKDGININGAIANTIVITDSGIYQVFISDSIGCAIYSDTITLALLDTPQVAIVAAIAVFCVGDSIRISSISADTLARQWLYNGAPINAATDTFYYAKQMGDYALSAINVCGKSSVSNSITIIQSIPVTTINPNGYVNICDGDSVSLTAVNIPGYSFQWFNDNTILNGVTNYSIMVSDSGNYFATIVDTLQCSANSDTIKITVSKLPDVTLSPAGIISNFVGNYLTLNAQSDSLNSFQWYRNGTLLPYAQSVTCHAYSSGVYLVRVTDSSGCFNYSQTLQLNGISNMDNNGVSTLRSFNDSTNNVNQIGVFPNPTNGITTIDLSNLAGKNFSVSMSSATGQLIFNHEKYKQQLLFIDAAQLSKGVYTLKIAGEVNGYKKIIVN